MAVFNSMGSNYDWRFAVSALFSNNSPKKIKKITNFLENKYQGKVHLFYKGREAMEYCLKSLKLPQNVSIAINGLTCYTVYKSVINAGYKIEYLDLQEKNLNFSPDTLKTKLKNCPMIKAVIVQNTLGYPCEIEEIAQICQQNKIILIEDLAHSVGTIYQNNKEAGTMGDFTVLSFSQDKMIDVVSGGALIIRNKKYQNIKPIFTKKIAQQQQLIDRFYPFLTFIIRKTYFSYLGKVLHFILKKANFLSRPMENNLDESFHQLTGWYCGLAYKQFMKLEKDLSHRRELTTIYSKVINQTFLSTVLLKDISFSGNLRFPIFVSRRTDLINELKKSGIFVSDIWYDAPIAPRKYLKLTDYKNQCPGAEKVSLEILNLPTHKNISNKKALEISQKINLWQKLP